MRARRGILAAIGAAFLSSGAAAEPLSGPEWTGLADGNTVFYERKGEPQGREYYVPGSGFAVFQTTDGACFEGPWAETDGNFCFWYGADFQCFAYYRRGDRIFSRADAGGAEMEVSRIAPGRELACVP